MAALSNDEEVLHSAGPSMLCDVQLDGACGRLRHRLAALLTELYVSHYRVAGVFERFFERAPCCNADREVRYMRTVIPREPFDNDRVFHVQPAFLHISR